MAVSYLMTSKKTYRNSYGILTKATGFRIKGTQI